MMRNRLGKLLFLTLFFSFFSLTGNAGIASQPISHEGDSTRLKVLSWNIYMLPAPIRITGKRKRAKAIGEVLSHSDYDVLLFQEAFHHGARRRLISRLSKTFPFRYGPVLKKKISLKIHSGLWVFSKIELTELGVTKFRQNHGFDNKLARKGAVVLEGKKSGIAFQILATHLNSGGPFAVRQSQLDQIMDDLLSVHEKDSVAQILCGDFNISKFNDGNYQAMLSTLESEDGELAEDGMSRFTFDGVNNPIPRSASHQAIIDFILIRRNNSNTNILYRKVPDIRFPWSKKTDFLSDHHPVEAVIDLR